MSNFLRDTLEQLNYHEPEIRAIPEECDDETIAVLIANKIYNSQAGRWEKIMFTKEEMCQGAATLFGAEDPMTIWFCRMAEKLDSLEDLWTLYILLIKAN